MSNEKVALIILDGYGIGEPNDSNAIYTAKTPVMDSLLQRWPHTTNLVPLVLVGRDLPLRPHGRLSDIAPTMLELMHIESKPAMTGESLIEKS